VEGVFAILCSTSLYFLRNIGLLYHVHVSVQPSNLSTVLRARMKLCMSLVSVEATHLYTLKMEAVNSSEISNITLRIKPEDQRLNLHHLENLKPHI